MLGNYLDYLPLNDFLVPRALANHEPETPEADTNPVDNEARNELGLIAVLVEKELMTDDDIRNRVMTYASNAQSRVPHSKAFVLEVDKNESTFKIASVLEKLYFEGVDTDLIDQNPLNNNSANEDDNRLIGTVLIGDVPIPVVHDDKGVASPSIYPYIDFYRKAYIYNHQSDHFEINGEVSAPNPEIWHGIIVPPSKDKELGREQLIEYFDKNDKYSKEEDGFADFEQRVMYANFPEMEKQMNFMDYSNYTRYIDYMEEMMMARFNKHLLKEMIKDVSSDMGTPDAPIMTDETIDQMMDVNTELIFKKYAVNFAEALRIYRSGINKAIENTGRWGGAQVDSPESLITLRDEYAKYQIRRKQLMLESAVNKAINDNIPEEERGLEVLTKANFKVKLKILNTNADTRTFSFYTFMDGKLVQDMESASQCGIRLGQRKPEGVSVLENNSVLVDANRMYNPATLLTPPKGKKKWKLGDQSEYKIFAGCTFNNSIKNKETKGDPAKCNPEAAVLSVFDIVGAIEVPKSTEVTGTGERCSLDKMIFKLLDENQFKSTAAGATVLAVTVGEKLNEVINTTYTKLGGNISGADQRQKASWVIKTLLASEESYTYKPLAGVEITVSATSESKNLNSILPRVEPTNKTIKAIKHIGTPRIDPKTGEINFPPIITPSTPADGIRSVGFSSLGIPRIFEYMNLFRLEGDNPGEIVGDLLKKIRNKQIDLDGKIGTQTDTFMNFFNSNSEIVEPLIWRAMSIDQKLKDIIPKYLNKNSFMPSPNYVPKRSPQNKPDGYEVLHIVADGDVHGYQFGLSRAMEAQNPNRNKTEEKTISGGTGTGGPDLPDGDTGDDGGNVDDDANYLCGDPSGVEIWEWFDALQCWIENEILPAHELFALSNVCATVNIPTDAEEDSEGLLESLSSKPSSFEVEMKRKSLVKDQEQKIKVSAFNQFHEPLLGYIDTPVHLALADSSLGEFSNNDFYIFSGQREVTFTAKKVGSTKLKVTMGDMPASEFTINVFDRIDIDWKSVESIVGGRSEFTMTLGLKDPAGKEILNINDSLILGAEQPADGGFENGGKVDFILGKAKTKFLPTPAKTEVTLISKDPFITGEYTIKPTGPKATQIILRAPPYLPIGETKEIEVIAADPFGFPGKEFSGTITIALDDKSKDYASLRSPNVTIINGLGKFQIDGGKETKDIKLTAKHADLRQATLELPLVARVDSEDWATTYPQNLFGSFIGFPAGDFTQEDYFGGVHLFSGKTEAVYSFLSAPKPEATLVMAPNNLITLTGNSQTVLIEFPGNQMLLQAFDQATVKTLVSKKVDLKFAEVKLLTEEAPAVGNLYVEILDTDFSTAKYQKGFKIRDSNGLAIANVQPDKIRISNPAYKWVYEPQPEFNVVELILTDGITTAARMMMSFELESLEPENFLEINPNLQWERIYGGKSINDPTGMYFSTYGAEVTKEDREEFYGIKGEQKYLSRFASGSSLGEATRFGMPSDAVLLGDPTIKLKTRSTSSLNFNSATGEQIYQDAEDVQIASINNFNFNNDGFQDIVILMEDGRIRLLEGGATQPSYVDRGSIANLADGGVALETFDFDNDNYDDLLVATEEGRLAILHNDKEVITRTDHKLNIGKKMYKLIKADMDQDGYDDLVIHDSRGDILIFYYNAEKEKFPESGKLIANYGYTLKLNSNVRKDIDIRYAGMPEPPEPGAGVASGPKPSLEDYGGGGSVDEDDALAFFEGLYAKSGAAAKNPGSLPEDTEVPKLPWPEDDETETYFAPIETFSSLASSKKVANKDRPGAKNVDLEETLTYTIELTSNTNRNNVVLADTVPDSLTFLKDSVTCLQGSCDDIKATQNSIRVFFSDFKLNAGQKTIITYDVFVAHTPESGILIQKIDEPNENLSNPYSIIDQYLDIVVSPPYNSTGRVLYHYSTGPRIYDITQDNPPEPAAADDPLGPFAEIMNQMQNLDPDKPDFKLKGMEGVLDEATGANTCFEDPSSSVTCAEGALDDIAGAIADFNCGGAGCFPMPYNYAFLVPPQMPMPILAFPATLPTPIGPMPMIASMFFPLPGMASIPGPIMSQLRLYISPTLTGGMGIAMCWGPYPFTPTVPPPVFPIPYPPPIGNCMVTAVPMMPKSVCDKIEDGLTYLMDQISAGVNKVNSVANDITNNPNVPISIQQGGPDESAGGMEIGLAINLGNSNKFDPPAKSFSNTHIPAFDSLGGVISGWIDRQTLEIQNRLLTLPTFSIFLPDFKSLWTLDMSKTEKRFTQWKNTISGTGKATIDSIENNPGQATAPGTESQTTGQKIRGGLQQVSGSKALGFMDGAEDIGSTYSMSTLEGLYDVARTLPLVKLRETPIQFNVPWLSSAEIQSFIMEMQNWVIYYEREYARVKDKWENLTCAVEGTDENSTQAEMRAAEKALAECEGRRLADAFGVNFDELTESVKQNIEVLQAWLAFPKQLIKFKQQLADYIRSVACYLEVIAQMMGGWMATIQQQMVSWAELILTIVEIVKNIKELFDVFTNFDSNCDICTNERFGNFGWWSLLGLVLPDIPVIQFPKWPDIVLDLSNIEATIDIELPQLNLRTIPLPLPPLPYITLPDFPSISIFLSLPPLPILPGPPELPDLPELPPIPTIDLPTLPPPPKLPDVGQAFELILPLLEKILNIWCLMKKSFAPVPEMALNDQITLLTNRPAYLIPLDTLKIQLPNIALFDLGFNEIRIETAIYLGLRIKIIAEPLAVAADQWNKWVKAIPDKMNEGYAAYIKAVEEDLQAKLDEVEQQMTDVVAKLEADWDKYVQGWLDEKVGDPLEEADKWARDREAAWEEWKNNQQGKIDFTYEEYVGGVNKWYDEVRRAKNANINEFFDKNRDIIHGLNYMIPGAALLEFANQKNAGDETQKMLDVVAEKLNEFESLGPSVLQRLYSCIRHWGDCEKNEARYFEGINEEQASSVPQASELPIQVAYQPQPINPEKRAKELLATPQGQQLKDIVAQITDVVNEVNEAEGVDYTVLKERFNVPDYKPAPQKTSVDKLRMIEEQLYRHSEDLMAEAHMMRNETELSVIAGMPPKNPLPIELASDELVQENNGRVYTNGLELPKNLAQATVDPLEEVRVDLQKQMDRRVKENTGTTSEPVTTEGCSAAVCLPDLVTGNSVPIIPSLDFSATSETLFMPSGDIVYSDGTGLYLKRDLTINYSGQNTDTSNPARFVLNDSFMTRLGMEADPKEAVNMLKTTFTENGAATFTWLPTSHPEVYGYGIELEHTVTGYDINRQDNNLPDTKIILLPPDATGAVPEVIVNGKPIESGTLVTSLKDEENAGTKFGVDPRHIITGASEVRFPTISNAVIKVNSNTAVYFDLLNGSAYTMNMENAYYQIKMTWFNEKARTSTYNQNEILSPQIYGDDSQPLDVSQSDTFYMPIYKKKTFPASDIFVDLAGSYKYYWFIDPDNNALTPQVGSTLTIAPQKEAKKIKVKLVASQNLEDDSFPQFEKTFIVQVYVPEIELNEQQLANGIIAGTLKPIPQAPDDDLSGIPFSVFRKRLGTWKNLGVLHAKDTEKTPTSPPLNDHEGKPFVYEDSYYSVGTDGAYLIENFDISEPSPVTLKDQNGDETVKIDADGNIKFKADNYELRAVPAGTKTPTRIAMVDKESEGIIGNIYYVASSKDDVQIVKAGLTSGNVRDKGVTVGDANTSDDIVAANIPPQGESFPGGVAIFNQTPPQVNIALIDTDGSIRMMRDNYELKLKNLPGASDRYVFQIVDNVGKPVYDTFINTDFDKVNIDTDTKMGGISVQIGLKNSSEKQYAQLAPNTEVAPSPDFSDTTEISDAQLSGSPFPDLDESHPYFKQILDLYKTRVISGYGDGSFRPDQKLTRAEFVKIALGVTNCYDCTEPTSPQRERYNVNPFPDVSLPAWFFYCISIAKELGMVTGYGDGQFRPDQNISRAEAAAVLLRQSEIEITEAPEAFFKDVPDYAWYVDYVYTAVEIGLIKSNFGFVNPEEQITRGEFAFMAAGVKDLRECRLVDEDGDGIPDWWEMTHDMDPLVSDAFRACPCFDNPNQSDTDGDGIRDICDLDIDNDGVLNPMCIFDDTGQVDPGLIALGAAGLGERTDNCIFTPNQNQSDLDSDGIGDLCDDKGIAICPCLDNPNKNDTDRDGVPDVCDDDIDNDSIKNPICMFDNSGLIDPKKVEEAKKTGPVDNCIFDENKDQADGDLNGVGNICEETDICPEVPEDMDGVNDEDGCPELDDTFDTDEKGPGVYVGPGELCSLIDYANDAREGDVFMTAITDIETHEVLYKKSKEAVYK